MRHHKARLCAALLDIASIRQARRDGVDLPRSLLPPTAAPRRAPTALLVTVPPRPTIPVAPRPIEEIVDVDELSNYRRAVGAFTHALCARLGLFARGSGEHRWMCDQQSLAASLSIQCRQRAMVINTNRVADDDAGVKRIDGAAFARSAMGVIRNLLDIVDHYQDCGAKLTDREILNLDGAANWIAIYDGEEPSEEP